jgi:hypothetical protein
MPQIPAAGYTQHKPNDSAANTLRTQVPPPTPDDIAKWRKSTIHAPGSVSKHPGFAEDTDYLSVPVYGKKTDVGYGVEELMQTAPKSYLIEQAIQKREAVYHSAKTEPLGVAARRGHTLPSELEHGHKPFGLGTPHNHFGLATKMLLAPVEPADALSEEVCEQYKKSHASYAPGEQRRRNYDWGGLGGGADPSAVRFGKPASETEYNAIYYALHPAEDPYIPAAPKIIAKALEDYKEVTTEALGRPKPVGHGDYSMAMPAEGFGQPSKRSSANVWNARQCMEGEYTLEQQRPDVDLGQSIRPGWRNLPPPDDRAFGIPNVRTDIREPASRSMADHQVRAMSRPRARDGPAPRPRRPRGRVWRARAAERPPDQQRCQTHRFPFCPHARTCRRAQNYGNEPSGGEVIAPSHFSQLSINEGEFLRGQTLEQVRRAHEFAPSGRAVARWVCARSHPTRPARRTPPCLAPCAAQIKSLFRAIQTPFGDDVLEGVYEQVAHEDEGHVSIASFRAKLFERL